MDSGLCTVSMSCRQIILEICAFQCVTLAWSQSERFAHTDWWSIRFPSLLNHIKPDILTFRCESCETITHDLFFFQAHSQNIFIQCPFLPLSHVTSQDTCFTPSTWLCCTVLLCILPTVKVQCVRCKILFPGCQILTLWVSWVIKYWHFRLGWPPTNISIWRPGNDTQQSIASLKSYPIL